MQFLAGKIVMKDGVACKRQLVFDQGMQVLWREN